MTIRRAEPLPECDLCATPTKRDVHERNRGLCTACTGGIADTVRMVPVRGADVVALDDLRRRRADRAVENETTAYVERYLPPVPGQLTLDECDMCDGSYICPTCRKGEQ